MHGLALNITIQTYAGHVDFGIVADKKALPHANDLVKAIAAAFRQAQTVFASPDEAVVLNGETPSSHVSKVTKPVKLESPPSARWRTGLDTVPVAHNE